MKVQCVCGRVLRSRSGHAHHGRVWFELDDGPGQPSRWITLRALRVLAWWDAAA